MKKKPQPPRQFRAEIKRLNAVIEDLQQRRCDENLASEVRIRKLQEECELEHNRVRSLESDWRKAKRTWNTWRLASKGQMRETGRDMVVEMVEPAFAQWHPVDFQELIDMFPPTE